MRNWKKQLAQRLLAARARVGSQAELASRAGVSDRVISMIEQGSLERPPRPKTIARLALAVGEDPTEWVQLAGLRISPPEIESLREIVKVKARLNEIEPAHAIKTELRGEIEQRLSEFIRSLEELRTSIRDFRHPDSIKAEVEGLIREYVRQFESPEKIKRDLRDDLERSLNHRLSEIRPAEMLRKELTNYFDVRISELRQVISDVEERVRQLAAWQMDLMRQFGLRNRNTKRRTISRSHNYDNKSKI